MSAFISDKSLMTIVGVLRDSYREDEDVLEALEECICGLEGTDNQPPAPTKSPETAAGIFMLDYASDLHTYVPTYRRLKDAAYAGFMAGAGWQKKEGK